MSKLEEQFGSFRLEFNEFRDQVYERFDKIESKIDKLYELLNGFIGRLKATD